MTPVTHSSGVGRAGGFSLVEMLVVLVIVGLVSTLLMEGFFQVESLRSRLTDRIVRADARASAAAWFRDSVQAAHAHRGPAFPIFTGDGQGFQAVSHAPLLGESGEARVVRWELVEDRGRVLLSYRQGDEAGWPVLTLADPGDPTPTFTYVARGGVMTDAWPPEGVAPGIVPAGIILAWARGGRPRIWAASVDGRHAPRADFSQL